LTTIEQATPVIEAIAVTDYYVTDTYEEVLKHKAAGRLPAAKLIFPNVELRLDVATGKRRPFRSIRGWWPSSVRAAPGRPPWQT
jgi:hypothetical protein